MAVQRRKRKRQRSHVTWVTNQTTVMTAHSATLFSLHFFFCGQGEGGGREGGTGDGVGGGLGKGNNPLLNDMPRARLITTQERSKHVVTSPAFSAPWGRTGTGSKMATEMTGWKRGWSS